jgi:hypothetical protein
MPLKGQKGLRIRLSQRQIDAATPFEKPGKRFPTEVIFFRKELSGVIKWKLRTGKSWQGQG